LSEQPNHNPAKNVIIFVGDGCDITTNTAARILKGQQKGQPGEEGFLSYEQFPYTGLSKTYNTDRQVPDSAGTANAMFTGVKTRSGKYFTGRELPTFSVRIQ
jgi:alkaline phosphatase